MLAHVHKRKYKRLVSDNKHDNSNVGQHVKHKKYLEN